MGGFDLRFKGEVARSEQVRLEGLDGNRRGRETYGNESGQGNELQGNTLKLCP